MTTLYDHRGRPVKTQILTESIADPSLTSVRQVWFDSVANSLTPETLATILAQVDQGDSISYLTLAEEMEERELHFSSVLRTRKLAVAGLGSVVESYTDSEKDVAVADAVRDLIADDVFEPMLMNLMDAVNKGYSVVEIIWDRSGKFWTPAEYKWRDPRFFVFDLATQSELRLRDAADAVNGIELPPYKFIIHRPLIKSGLTIRGGLARLVAVAYMCKGYTLKDWMAFMEVFGMPLRLGKHAPNATSQQKAQLLRAVGQIGTDAAAIIPEGMMIEFVESGKGKSTGGDKLFEAAAVYLDKLVSKGVIGQTMSADDGSSLAQAEVHDRVRRDILVSDAKQVSSTVRRYLIKPFVDLNFGPRQKNEYPKAHLNTEEPEDLEKLSRSVSVFIDRGLRVSESVVRDKFGLPEPEDGEVILQPKDLAKGGGIAVSAKKQVDLAVEEANKEPEDEPAEKEPVAPIGSEKAPDKKAPDKKAPEQLADENAEEDLENARQATMLNLMRRVRRGETLTADQRAVLVALAANSAPAGDEVSDLATEEVNEWERVMDPLLKPIIELASRSKSFDEFSAGLEKALESFDSAQLISRLAVTAFKAQGIGDGTKKKK